MEVFFIMAKKGQKFNKYSLDFKLKILNERVNEGKACRYLAKKYNISRKTIETWERIFKRDGSLDSKKKGRPKKDEKIDYQEKYEILKKFQEFLEEVDQEKK